MRAVVFSSNSRSACIQYASSPSPAIERGCSIGANHAQNCPLTISDLTTRRVAIAQFRIIRARFNKRSTQAFPKADHRSDICNAPLPDSNIDDELITGETFQLYVETILVRPSSPATSILDNLGSHKAKVVCHAICEAGARLFYLPKYSPDFNPIEQFFAKLKHWLRKAARRTTEAV
jgi:hypothetical protein